METLGRATQMKKKHTFKSYYVVWKHRHKIEVMTDAKGFKSYYVVWKRRKKKKKKKKSLNRTM